MQSLQAVPSGPEEQEPNLPFIGLSIFISQLRKEGISRATPLFHVSCTSSLARCRMAPRGSSMPQGRKKNRALLLSVWWNLVPRFLSLSLLLPFSSAGSLQVPGPGVWMGIGLLLCHNLCQTQSSPSTSCAPHLY